LRWLARRDYTSKELLHRLTERGVPEASASAVVNDLEANGLVNDQRAAAAHVRTASRVKGRGPRRIRLELEARGVDAGAIAEALAEVSSDEIDLTIQRLIDRKHPTRPIPREDRDRLFRQLLRRGFPTSAIQKALGR
jgi:regulatory protein